MINERARDVPMTPDGVHIQAPAKINLTLKVLDRRQDGFHNLWSVMQTVSLVDELKFQLAPSPGRVHLRSDHPTLPTDDSNLIVRAVRLVLRQSRQSWGVDIDLRKGIPMGAGLGGGSSDAAATIVALNHLLDLRWPVSRMVEIAKELGSDVPFFFSAPTGLVEGRGEMITPLSLKGPRWVLLVKPEYSIETKWAYGELARWRNMTGYQPIPFDPLSTPRPLTWDRLIPRMENDFEEPLYPSFPTLKEMKSQMVSLGAEVALLSGSGSTVFGIFRQQEKALRAKSTMKLDQGAWASVAKTCSTPLISHTFTPAMPAP